MKACRWEAAVKTGWDILIIGGAVAVTILLFIGLVLVLNWFSFKVPYFPVVKEIGGIIIIGLLVVFIILSVASGIYGKYKNHLEECERERDIGRNSKRR